MLKHTLVLVCFALLFSSFNCQDEIEVEVAPEALPADVEVEVETPVAAAVVPATASEVEAEQAPEVPADVEIEVETPELAPEVAPAAVPVVAPVVAPVAAPVEAPVGAAAPLPSIIPAILPPANLTLYLIEPFFYTTDVNNQIIGYLFCQSLDISGVTQCTIYDGADPALANLIGIEYILNETLFNSLPQDEQVYWHSHGYAVQSGNVIAPNLTGADYTNTLTTIAGTYGKAVLVKPVAQGLPIGIPVLIYAFAGPNQFNAAASQIYDTTTGIPAAQRVANNANITIPPVADGANYWQSEGFVPTFIEQDSDLSDGLWGLSFSQGV